MVMDKKLLVQTHVGCFSYKLYRLFLTPHRFSVTLFTLGFRLFFILLQINWLENKNILFIFWSRLGTVFARKTPKNEEIRTFAQFAIALGKPMKKE